MSNPFLSADGLSAADPVVDYGVTRKEAEDLQALNALLDIATQAAINHGCLAVQESLDLGCGDVAGMHFAVPERVRPVAQAMIEYIGSELALTFGQEFRT